MTNTDKTVSAERLEDARVRFIGAKARVDDEGMVDVPGDYLDEGIAAFTELLASRTQEPAELQVALKPFADKVSLIADDADEDYTPDWSPFIPVRAYRDAAAALRAASITPPAPERSKEEVVGLCISAIQAERDKPIEGPEHGAWDRGKRDGLTKAIKILSALEPASLHKADPTEEMIVAGLGVDFDNEDDRATVINVWHAMSAAAPLSVTITDEMADAALAKSRDKALDTLTNTEAMRQIILAALSKPGEQ